MTPPALLNTGMLPPLKPSDDGEWSAQAIEARRAETGTGSVHESAVGTADAPETTPSPTPTTETDNGK